MEPLTLALLALPGDPWDVFGPVLEHPEVLLAKGGATKKAAKKLLRALKRRRLSELYPEWWGVWRYAPYHLPPEGPAVLPNGLPTSPGHPRGPFLRGANPSPAVPAQRRRGGLGVRVWDVAHRRRHWGSP